MLKRLSSLHQKLTLPFLLFTCTSFSLHPNYHQHLNFPLSSCLFSSTRIETSTPIIKPIIHLLTPSSPPTNPRPPPRKRRSPELRESHPPKRHKRRITKKTLSSNRTPKSRTRPQRMHHRKRNKSSKDKSALRKQPSRFKTDSIAE